MMNIKILLICLVIAATIAIAPLYTTSNVYAGGKGLKLYLTVDTNLRSQNIDIDTYQRDEHMYNHDGFMNTGRNEYTLNYPDNLISQDRFEICISTNDGEYCSFGHNSEASKPESVFISAFTDNNMGEIQGDSQSQSQSQSQDQSQSQSQSQDNDQDITIYNCPPNSKCVIEQR